MNPPRPDGMHPFEIVAAALLGVVLLLAALLEARRRPGRSALR